MQMQIKMKNDGGRKFHCLFLFLIQEWNEMPKIKTSNELMTKVGLFLFLVH